MQRMIFVQDVERNTPARVPGTSSLVLGPSRSSVLGPRSPVRVFPPRSGIEGGDVSLVNQVGQDRRSSERERSQPWTRRFAGRRPPEVQADIACREMIRELGVARQIAGEGDAILQVSAVNLGIDVEIGRHRSRRAAVARSARGVRSPPSRRGSV